MIAGGETNNVYGRFLFYLGLLFRKTAPFILEHGWINNMRSEAGAVSR